MKIEADPDLRSPVIASRQEREALELDEWEVVEPKYLRDGDELRVIYRGRWHSGALYDYENAIYKRKVRTSPEAIRAAKAWLEDSGTSATDEFIERKARIIDRAYRDA